MPFFESRSVTHTPSKRRSITAWLRDRSGSSSTHVEVSPRPITTRASGGGNASRCPATGPSSTVSSGASSGCSDDSPPSRSRTSSRASDSVRSRPGRGLAIPRHDHAGRADVDRSPRARPQLVDHQLHAVEERPGRQRDRDHPLAVAQEPQVHRRQRRVGTRTSAARPLPTSALPPSSIGAGRAAVDRQRDLQVALIGSRRHYRASHPTVASCAIPRLRHDTRMRRVAPPRCVIALVAGDGQPACGATVTGTVYIDRNADRVRQADEPGVAGVVVALDRGASPPPTPAASTSSTSPAARPASCGCASPTGSARVRCGARREPASSTSASCPLTADEAAAPLTLRGRRRLAHTNNPADPWDGGDLDERARSGDRAAGAAALLHDRRRHHAGQPAATSSTRVEAALAELGVAVGAGARQPRLVRRRRDLARALGPRQLQLRHRQPPRHRVGHQPVRGRSDRVLHRRPRARRAVDDAWSALGHASPQRRRRRSARRARRRLPVHRSLARQPPGRARRASSSGARRRFVMGTHRSVAVGLPRRHVRGRRARSSSTASASLEPHLALTAPHPGSCASPPASQLIVAAALDAATPEVTRATRLRRADRRWRRRGGWSFGGRGAGAGAGHRTPSRARDVAVGREPTRAPDRVRGVRAADRARRSPATGRSSAAGPPTPAHAPRPIAPPLTQRWATSVGGNVVARARRSCRTASSWCR